MSKNTFGNLSKLEKRTEAKELIKMIAASIDANGDLIKIDPTNQDFNYELSDFHIKYILKKLRKHISLKVNKDNWTILSRANIALAFVGSGNQTEQENILNIIAPMEYEN